MKKILFLLLAQVMLDVNGMHLLFQGIETEDYELISQNCYGEKRATAIVERIKRHQLFKNDTITDNVYQACIFQINTELGNKQTPINEKAEWYIILDMNKKIVYKKKQRRWF